MAEYTKVFIPLNTNRTVPRTVITSPTQRPNFSVELGEWLQQNFLLLDITSDYQRGKFILTSNEIKNMYSSPVDFLPNPGAGKVLLLTSLVLDLEFNSVAYSGNQVIQFKMNGNNVASDSTILASTSSKIKYLVASGNSTLTENTGITITTNSANPADGDSPITIYYEYRILTL